MFVLNQNIKGGGSFTTLNAFNKRTQTNIIDAAIGAASSIVGGIMVITLKNKLIKQILKLRVKLTLPISNLLKNKINGILTNGTAKTSITLPLPKNSV